MNNISINVYDELNTEIVNEWLKLEERNKDFITIFQTYEWQKKWIENFCNSKQKLFLVLATKGNNQNSKLILPLILKKNFFFNILEFTGYPFSDFNLPIHDRDFKLEDFHFVLKEIVKKEYSENIDAFIFINQIEELNNKKNEFFLLKDFLKFEDKISYKIDISKIQNENILNEVKLKFVRQDIRRIEKKIDIINFEVCETEEKKKKAIEDIIYLKSEQYIRENSWNFLEHKKYQNFLKSFLNSTHVHLSLLKINNNIAAAHYGFIYNKIYYYIFPVYKNNFKNFSPGNLLLYRIINNQLKNIGYFDFTVGNEVYKSKWSNYQSNMSDIIKPISFLGKILILHIKFKKFISKNTFLKKKLRVIYHKFKN